jgi:predicted branched-subunit amino acid permease
MSNENHNGRYVLPVAYFGALPFLLSTIYVYVRVPIYKSGNKLRFVFDDAGAKLAALVVFIGPWVILATALTAIVISFKKEVNFKDKLAIWGISIFEVCVWLLIAGWFGKQ